MNGTHLALITLLGGAMLVVIIVQDLNRRKSEKLLQKQQVEIETLSAVATGARVKLSLELRTGRRADENFFGGAEL